MPSENILYRGFAIKQNDYGTFNVPTINCFSTPTVESAKAAIDRYEERKAEHLKTAVREVQMLLPGDIGALRQIADQGYTYAAVPVAGAVNWGGLR